MIKTSYKLLLDIYRDDNALSPFIKEVSLNPYPLVFYKNTVRELVSQNVPDFFFIRFVPEYFNLCFLNQTSHNLKKVTYLKGCAITLDNFENENDYVKHQFKKKADNIRRYVKRLESSFDIEYKMYYGSIDIDKYHLLLDQMSEMILKRFDTLTETNNSLKDLTWIREKAHELILAKNASLFVIYNQDRPVSITFNFIHDKFIFAYLSGFDIDYRKFGMGHVYIFKQLQWCFEHHFSIYEMGWGAYDYKQRWCNLIYDSKHYLFYRNRKIVPILMANIEIANINFKKILKSIKVDVYLKQLKGLKNASILDSYKMTLFKDPINQFSQGNKLINIHDDQNSFLRKYIYDFLYSGQENESDIHVFEISKNINYLVKGKNRTAEITRIREER
jgi:hypothetical protein